MQTIEDYFPTQYTNLTRISVGTQWKYPGDRYWNTVTLTDSLNMKVYYLSEDDPAQEKVVHASDDMVVIVKITNSAVTSLNRELIGEPQSWPRPRVVSKG